MVRVKLEDEVFYGAWGLLVLHMMGWATFDGLPVASAQDSLFETMRRVAVEEVAHQKDVLKQEDFLEEAKKALNSDLRRLFEH